MYLFGGEQMKILNCLAIVFWSLNSIVLASEDIKDKYPQSELYNKPVEVIPNVFSAIAMPTAFASPSPSVPVVVSTPSVRCASGWPGVLE